MRSCILFLHQVEVLNDRCESGSNHILKCVGRVEAAVHGMANFTRFNTPVAIKKVS